MFDVFARLATYIIIAYFFHRCIRVFPYQSIIRSAIAPRARMSRIVVQAVGALFSVLLMLRNGLFQFGQQYVLDPTKIWIDRKRLCKGGSRQR